MRIETDTGGGFTLAQPTSSRGFLGGEVYEFFRKCGHAEVRRECGSRYDPRHDSPRSAGCEVARTAGGRPPDGTRCVTLTPAQRRPPPRPSRTAAPPGRAAVHGWPNEGGDGWRNHILWVDDRPENNTYERQAFEAMGIRFTLALSTHDAFERLERNRYAAVISDMGRREGSREGYVLLDRLRQQDERTPLFFYVSSNAPEHKRETREHGGQGCTNNAQELFEMVTRAVISRQAT